MANNNINTNDRSNLAGFFTSQSTNGALSGNRGGITNSTNPNQAIPEAVRRLSMDTSSRWSFPSDLPPIHFGMVETEWARAKSSSALISSVRNIVSAVSNNLNPFNEPQSLIDVFRNTNTGSGSFTALEGIKLFRFPLPTPLQEQFEVNFNPNFAPLSPLLGGFTAPGSAIFGAIPNTFKTVTLSQPDFRRHKFMWTLVPRTHQESISIQTILLAIKKGMHPKKSSIGRLILEFPNIYLPYFSPNPKFLFKFKPCVIENIEINYAGGQQVPAFYRAEGGTQSDKAPESVSFSITFLELEYWMDSKNSDQSDFKTTADGMPTNEPFDSLNYFELSSAILNNSSIFNIPT